MDETTRMLELLNASFPRLATMDPLDGRAAADERIRPATNLDDVAATDDGVVDAGTHGIPIRTYHPREWRPDAPTTVYAHGGGFLHGSIAGHDGFCRRWARATGATVVSVDYRLAPEAGPGAGARRRDRRGGLGRRGRARGARAPPRGRQLGRQRRGLARRSASAIAARARSSHRCCYYPFLDPTMSSESHRARATGYFVTSELLAHYWRTFLGERPGRFDADVTPLAVDDLAGLPPAIVVTAGLDPLCDEGADYARRLRSAGVPVTLRHHPDQFHGFLTIPGYGPGISAAEILWSDLRSLTSPDPKDRR